MTDEDTLTKFVDYACGKPTEWEDRKHCLIFWGHGTELLLDQEPDGTSRYLTPAKLRKALMNTQLIPKSKNPETAAQCKKPDDVPDPRQSKKLDIVAFDACNMSMIELASELQECAHFMIASQEDVPDASFPYEDLIPDSRNSRRIQVEICKEVPKVYTKSFQDYHDHARQWDAADYALKPPTG